MTNRNMLLGRARPREKLSKEETAALVQVAAPPAPPVKAKPSGEKGGGPQRPVRREILKFRWSPECPGCGFKAAGPKPNFPCPTRASVF